MTEFIWLDKKEDLSIYCFRKPSLYLETQIGYNLANRKENAVLIIKRMLY